MVTFMLLLLLLLLLMMHWHCFCCFLQKIWAFYKNLLVVKNSSIEVYLLTRVNNNTKNVHMSKKLGLPFWLHSITYLFIIKNMIKNYINQVFSIKHSFVLVQNSFFCFNQFCLVTFLSFMFNLGGFHFFFFMTNQ